MNKKFKLVSMVMTLVMLFAAVPAFAAPPAEDGKTIVDIAVEDGRFTTLVTALQEAGLVETLSGDGPFTVFAPTDDAFAALPDGTLEGLLADKMALANVLTYHVVPGNVMAADVVNLNAANSVQGESIAIMADASGVKVNDANVIITDIAGSNGVIHVIDAVILPPSMTAEAMPATMPSTAEPTIVDIAVEDGRFTTLFTALQEAGLVETLSGDGPFTVFAPTDDAFAALPDGTLEGLLADKMALANVLTYHVVPGNVMAADVVNLSSANSVQGEPIAIMADASGVKVNDANVIITDIAGSNGVIHVIDSVILPPSMTAEAVPATLPATGGEMPVSNQTMLVLLILGASLVLIGGGLTLSLRSAENR